MTSTYTFHVTSVDPRCPYCGRPVLGPYVQGAQGRYHPECTQPPPASAPWPTAPLVPLTPFPWQEPSNPYPGPFHAITTCGEVERSGL